MPNVLDGSSTLESPTTTVPTDDTSIDSTTSIQTNQTITPPSPTNNTQTFGFCYSCNRRSIIDTSNFSCASCSSGFVELIVDETTTSRTRTTNQASDIELESLFDNSLLRLINLSPPERRNNRFVNLFQENSEPDPSATSSSSESDPLFSRFRPGLRRNEPNRTRYRNLYNLGDNLERDDESSSRSSSSSRRRSRSPPSMGRPSSRPFYRSRIFNYFDDDSNMLLDHGAIIITTVI